jgi:hypothetical protein
MSITTEMEFIMQLEEVLEKGSEVTGFSFNISYDGDHKSCEIIVDNGEKEVCISSSDVSRCEYKLQKKGD